MDGSIINRESTFGGILLDFEGKWIWGFAGSYGLSSPSGAELRAMEEGLITVHNNNCMQVIIELDSSTVFQLINGYREENHPFLQLIHKKLHR